MQRNYFTVLFFLKKSKLLKNGKAQYFSINLFYRISLCAVCTILSGIVSATVGSIIPAFNWNLWYYYDWFSPYLSSIESPVCFIFIYAFRVKIIIATEISVFRGKFRSQPFHFTWYFSSSMFTRRLSSSLNPNIQDSITIWHVRSTLSCPKRSRRLNIPSAELTAWTGYF